MALTWGHCTFIALDTRTTKCTGKCILSLSIVFYLESSSNLKLGMKLPTPRLI